MLAYVRLIESPLRLRVIQWYVNWVIIFVLLNFELKTLFYVLYCYWFFAVDIFPINVPFSRWLSLIGLNFSTAKSLTCLLKNNIAKIRFPTNRCLLVDRLLTYLYSENKTRTTGFHAEVHLNAYFKLIQ